MHCLESLHEQLASGGGDVTDGRGLFRTEKLEFAGDCSRPSSPATMSSTTWSRCCCWQQAGLRVPWHVCVVIEDAAAGVEAAMRATWPVAELLLEGRTPGELAVDLVVDSLADLGPASSRRLSTASPQRF